MKEIRMQKFNFIRLIYSVIILIFLTSAFLPYFSKKYAYPLPPAEPIISYTKLYDGYIELLFGGWVGLGLLVVSVILLNFERKGKAIKIGGLGCALIGINLMIRPLLETVSMQSGFYVGLIFWIGLCGINVFALISKEGILTFSPSKLSKREPIVKIKPVITKEPVAEIKPVEIKEEMVFGTDWEKREFIANQAINYIKTKQLTSKELPFFEIISKTGIKREVLDSIVNEMIENHEINANVRDFVIIFKEISKEEKEKRLKKIKIDLKQKMSEVDALIAENRFDKAIVILYDIIENAEHFKLEDVVSKAKEKMSQCKELEIEKRDELEEQRIREDLQSKMSEITKLIEQNKIKNALKDLNLIKETANKYNLSEFLNQAEEKIKQCEKLELEVKKDKEQVKTRNKILKILSKSQKLIEKNKLNEALENLVDIRETAIENGFTELLTNIEEKIDYCKHFQFDTINKIKNTVLNLGSKFARLELVDIHEKSGIDDEQLIEKVILEMIKNREINAEYFSSSKSIAFLQIEKEVKPVSKPEKLKQLRVFLSYSTLDAEHFRISDIVKNLEMYTEIKKASYWQADSKQNIVEFMEDTLKNTDAFVLFCSENSVKSDAVKDEWQAAFQMRKKGLLKIIPVYEDEEHIPVLLWQMLNVKYNKDNFEAFIEKLYEEILR